MTVSSSSRRQDCARLQSIVAQKFKMLVSTQSAVLNACRHTHCAASAVSASPKIVPHNCPFVGQPYPALEVVPSFIYRYDLVII